MRIEDILKSVIQRRNRKWNSKSKKRSTRKQEENNDNGNDTIINL